MKIAAIILILHCTFSNGFHERDNDNVLVPNNDANVRAKIKNLVYSDGVELSDNEIVKYRKLHRVKKNNKEIKKEIDVLMTNDIENDLVERPGKDPANYILPTLPPSPTPLPNPSTSEECLLGSPKENIKWVNELGKLQMLHIVSNDEMKDLKVSDFSYDFADATFDFRLFLKDSHNMILFKELQVLSLAYNNFNQLPQVLLNESESTLLYLSLAGNDFKALHEEKPALSLPELIELDLRSCGLKTIWENFFKSLSSLELLFLSYNNIMTLQENSLRIPHLLTLDLSYNEEERISADYPNRLRIPELAFAYLKNLQILDLSHTRLEIKSVISLTRLPPSLVGISLCYTDIIFSGQRFLSNLSKIKFLDISGNPQINFTRTMFNDISRLERLDARDSNVRNLDWAHPLTKLKVLNLKDNKIHELDNSSFSFMFELEDLNLEKNSIGNWFTRIFQNQELKTLNLRENSLSQLSSEMTADLMSVKFLALGKNKFECSCILQQFMHALFESTRKANLTELRDDLENVSNDEIESTTLQSVIFGVRSNIRPEYDVLQRVYDNYYNQVLMSIEALQKNDYKSKSLISTSELSSGAVSNKLQTVLLDYDDNNEDYQCINVRGEGAVKKLLLELNDLCDSDYKTSYNLLSDATIMALATSIPTMLIISVLLLLVYWKWYNIRYFCILCKNSAILTFMDDDDGKEAIVRSKSNSSVDIFLYDVFVSYCDSDRDWVLNEFLLNIEKRESINVCLHERDFAVGFGILENIVTSMDRSRCLLLLISKNFLQSQWCQFEMNLAQHRLLETRREKLIMVFLEDISEKRQPKILKYLMRTKTYIKWPLNGTESEKQLFWKRLKKSIVNGNWENVNYETIA